MMSVQDVLDQLADGDMTVDQAAANFAARDWPAPATMTLSDALQGNEVAAVPDSWDVVNADSRLDPDTYQRLAQAAFGG